MRLIIKNATVISPNSAFHNKKADLKITGNIIQQISASIEPEQGYDELHLPNLHVSEGWFDTSVSFGEPGFEERETILNGLDVAGKSGFAGVAVQPSANPVADSQAFISLLKAKAIGSATSIYPIGALTKQSEGKDLAELFDMKNAGAVAFGDYNKSLSNANLMKIALQYSQDFNATVIAFSEDRDLRGNGVANEGTSAATLGLKGIPALAEELIVARNLYILEYAGGKMHIPTISTSGSVKLIRAAKKKGLNVTCSASVHHLVLTDASLENFDSNFRVTPPLRDDSDRLALIEGIVDGTIDAVTSDHNPIDIEHKKMEFDLAMNGTIGLESAFGALCTVIPMELAVEKFVSGKDIFGVERHPLAENSKASFTLFDPDKKYEFSESDILSKSRNSAMIGRQMQGQAYGIINSGKILLR